MLINNHEPKHSLHLVWITTKSLAMSLDAATWLETTRELGRLGWQVTLINAGSSGWNMISGVRTYGIWQPRIYLLGKILFHLKLLLLLATWWSHIDVILFHQMSFPWMLPLRIWRQLNRRCRRPLFVMDVRTVPMSRTTGKDKVRALFSELVSRLAHRWTDGQTAITDRIAKEVHMNPEELWGIWPSGVSMQMFNTATLDRNPPPPEIPIRLIYIGSLFSERNLIALCRAVKAANTGELLFSLSIIGDGPDRANLEAFALQTKGWLTILPPVPHESIPKLLGEAHIGVLPFPDERKFRVSSPIKLFEYMAAGLPILATRIACHTDVLGDADFVFWAKTGEVEDLESALRQVWLTRASLRALGEKATAAAANWTWEASARKLNDALYFGMAQRSTVSRSVRAR